MRATKLSVSLSLVVLAAAVLLLRNGEADQSIQKGQSRAQKAIVGVASIGGIPGSTGPTPTPGTPSPLNALLGSLLPNKQFGFGGAQQNVAMQQLTAQSDIQVATPAVAALSGDIAQTLGCLENRGNGAQTPGCTNNPASTADVSPYTRTLLASAGPTTSVMTNSKLVEPFGVFVTGRFGQGSLDSTSGQTGFDSDQQSLNAVLDYRLSQRVVTGLSIGFQHSKLDLDFNSGNLKNNTYRVAPFVFMTVGERGYIDALIGYGWMNFDSIRICSACTPSPVSSASFNGKQYLASLGGGYVYPSGPWSLRGYLRGDYVQVQTDAYTENSSITSTALHVDSQTVRSLTSVTGAEVGYTLGTSYGVLIPRARLEWVHEFQNPSKTLSAKFVADPAIPVVAFATNGAVKNWANLGLGLQMNFGHSLSAFVDYQRLLKEDEHNNLFSIGVRYEF